MFGWFKKNKKNKQVVESKAVEEEVNQNEEYVEKNQDDNTLEIEESDSEAPVKKKRKAIYHVTKHIDGGWQVKKEGAQRAQKRFNTQKEAIDFAKEIEKTTGTSYIIHKANGSTRKKTY